MNMNTHWKKFARTQSIGTLSTTRDVIRHTIDQSINADNEDCNANNDTDNNDNSDNNDNDLIGGITGDSGTTGDGVGPTINSYTITINDDENTVPFKKLSTNTNTITNLIHIAEDSKNNTDYQARFGFFSKDGDTDKYFLTLYDDNKTLYFDSINSISLINRTDSDVSYTGFTINYIKDEIVYRTENTTIKVTPNSDN